MADLGTRILSALRSITTDPALVTKVQQLDTSDQGQTALLDQLGTTTSTLASQLSDLREEFDKFDGLSPEQQAKFTALSDTIASLDAAFPDAAPPVEGETSGFVNA